MDVKHQTMTRREYRDYADKEARRMLGVSYDQALVKLESGELQGTLAATRLSMMASMLETSPEPLAAE